MSEDICKTLLVATITVLVPMFHWCGNRNQHKLMLTISLIGLVGAILSVFFRCGGYALLLGIVAIVITLAGALYSTFALLMISDENEEEFEGPADLVTNQLRFT